MPAGTKLGNMQAFRSSVAAVLNGTAIAQFVGEGTPTVKGTAKTPALTAFVAFNVVVTGPGVVGVPEIMPVAESRLKPIGKTLLPCKP